MSSEGVEIVAFMPPFDDKTGALDKKELHYTKFILYDKHFFFFYEKREDIL